MAVHKASSQRIEVLSRTTGDVDQVISAEQAYWFWVPKVCSRYDDVLVHEIKDSETTSCGR